MTGKKITFYILAAFVAGILVLTYIQYNSAKNISTLINGNEKLLGEFEVSHKLKELESDIFSMESKIRDTAIIKDLSGIEGLEEKIKEVESDLDQLQQISDDDSSVKYIDILDTLVHEKLFLTRQIADSFHIAGNGTNGYVAARRKGRRITDSIMLTSQMIDNTRQKLLTTVTSPIDESGKKAKSFGTLMIVLVMISGAVLFWYIINTILKQTQLIKQLNISEKKVREVVQVKENFIANMSHEIRTPMNAILGFTNLLQRQDLNETSKEYVQTIQRASETLLAIINDILDLSKIEAGMMRIESAPFSIRSVLHAVETIFSSKMAEKHLQFSYAVDKSVPGILEGDAMRLTQILVNLVGNALKFTDKGTISVKITNEESTSSLVKIGIAVSDTGIGIEKDKFETIFERFQQAEDSVTRKYGGTGLGLSIVNDLVLLQHGTVKVESQPGKGTTFSLVIPYNISAAQAAAGSTTEVATEAPCTFDGTSALVVEDNKINQALIKHLFTTWHLEFDVVNDGKEAVSKLQNSKYDLILMDIQMPVMDGYTASLEIRNKLKLDTPIIAMTAHAHAGQREKCLGYGMNEYISKPIREEELHRLIAQFAPMKIPAGLRKLAAKHAPDEYENINLQYMKEVSGGNTEYERTVTSQFIEAIPGELRALKTAWHAHNLPDLRQVAHNMKTTVSVMGLNDVLQPYLNSLEYDNVDEEAFMNNFRALQSICEASVEEAKHFYSTI